MNELSYYTLAHGDPKLDPPQDVGPLTVADVLTVEPGPGRDKKLMDRRQSVWAAWSSEQGRVKGMVARFL
jgi:hypothetical protein